MRCRNPLFKGSTVACWVWDDDHPDSLVWTSQSPVQRVYCCMRCMTIQTADFRGVESQSPVQRVYCCMYNNIGGGNHGYERSQSPVQRVYCCMFDRYAFPSVLTPGTSQSPVQRVYCCMWVGAGFIRISVRRSQSPVQRVYCCMVQQGGKVIEDGVGESQSPVQRVYCCMPVR